MSFLNVTDRGWSEITKRENPWWRWGLTLNAVPGLEFSFRIRLSQQLSLKYFKRQRYKSRFLRLVWCPCPLQMTAAHRQPWCDSPRQPRTKECSLAVMYRMKCKRQHHKIINLLFYSPVPPWRNIKSFLQKRFFKSFWFQWWCMRYKLFFPKNILNHSSQFSKDYGKYMEKYSKIWTSKLRWDIYGFNKDDPDIYGFLYHWHTIIKSAQSCEW